MTRKMLLLIAINFAFLAIGCGSTPTDAASTRAAIAADFPAVDGSTSAHPLQRLAACDILNVPCVWSETTVLAPERTVILDPQADIPEHLAQTVMAINPSGTNGSYLNLIEGVADVILVARAPSEDELRAAEAQGVTLDVRPAALDAFVFLAHVDNPVESLSVDTLRDIYTGEITEWSEVGITIGPNGQAPIHAYQRDQNSGSQELMESLVMQDTPMIDAPEMITLTMLGPFNAIGGDTLTGNGDPLGLGYTVYYYATMMFPHQSVKLIAVEGVPPTAEMIASRAYPLVTEVYVVVRADTPQDSTAILFRDWLLSDDGQRVVEQSGYVPIRDQSDSVSR